MPYRDYASKAESDGDKPGGCASILDLEFRSLGKYGIGRATHQDVETGRLIPPRFRLANHRKLLTGELFVGGAHQGRIVRGSPVRLGLNKHPGDDREQSCDL